MPWKTETRKAAPQTHRPSKGASSRTRGPTVSSPAPPTPMRDYASAALLYVAATLILSYPLALHPATLSRLDNGDARLNAWAISWVAHQVVQDPLSLFEANTFHPLPHSLAYSEHLALLGVLALPLLRLTGDLVLTNNLLLLFSMWASAMAMYFLARTLTRHHLASLLAGLFFSFAAFRFNRLPHLQMQLYAFLPLFLAFWHRYVDQKKTRDLVLATVFFVLQALSGTYLGAIGAVALAGAFATLAPFSGFSRRELLSVALALAAAAAVLAPFAAPYLWVHRELGIEWDLPGVASLSATPSSYLASSSHLYRSLSEELWHDHPPTDYLFPGVSVTLLSIAGAVALGRSTGGRKILFCYGLILVLGVSLSLGPRTPLHPFLYEHLVFFRGLRALTRFGLLPLLSMSVLSAAALAWLFEARGGLSRAKLVSLAIALFFAVETTALPYPLEPWTDEPPEVYGWLAQAKPGPIVELPFKVIDTQYMFWARHHRFRPMLNGDSGFVPMSHQWMKNAFSRFPSPDAIALLRRLKVRYVVLHLGAFREGGLLRLLGEMNNHRADLIPARDFGRDLVFEVVPGVTDAAPKALTPVTRLPAPGPEMALDLPAGAVLGGLRLHYGPTPRVPVARVEIFRESESGSETLWSTPSDWPAVTELVSGLLETPRDGTQTIVVEPSNPSLTGRLQLRLYG
ncbi:MAG TPA: hypothetical protein VJ921_01975, partial [Vicinamibacteria bacterium]|nr:hypothetical protein [Vicinamibacteria bacterium]